MKSTKSASQSPDTDYAAILRGIWRRHKLLVAAMFLGIALPLLAVVYYTTSPLYLSQALISVEPSALSQIPFLREPPRDDAIASQLVLLKSRSLSEAVIDALPKDTLAELLAQPQYLGYYWLRATNRIKGWFGQPITVLSPHEQAVAELREARMEFLPLREAPNVFSISATATSPRVAVDLVNTHIQVLLSRSRSVDNQEAKKGREFLEVQFQQVKDNVTRGEEAILKLQEQKGRLRSGGQTELELVRLAQLEGALADAQANRQILSTRIASVRAALGQAQTDNAKARAGRTGSANEKDATAAASPVGDYQARAAAFKAAQDQLARLESKLATLRERYTEAHPQVQNTQDEITRQQARVMQLARELPTAQTTTMAPATPSDQFELQRQLANLERESEAVATKEEALKLQVARLRGNLRNLSQDDLEFGNLRRSVESNRNLMAVLSDRLMAARIREQGDSNVIRIVDPASFPLQTNASKTRKLMLVVMAIAGSIAFGLAFGVEFWHQPVETEADLERNIVLPVLGSVARMDGATLQKHKRETKPILLSGYPAGAAAAQSRSIHVEPYRAIRANIETERLKSPFRSILLTSPAPHEGKSTTALNLAHVFQEFGRRVLLVEADLRRPVLASPLGLTNKPGIVDYLNGAATFAQVCRSLSSGVTIIPGQVAREDAASLLASPRFKELLREATNQFDLVLVDSAPILAVPDNLLLSNIVDRVIVVVKATATSMRDLRKAKAALERAGGQILGVVLNQANPRDVPYYHAKYRKYYTASDGTHSRESSRRPVKSPRMDEKKVGAGPIARDDTRKKDLT
jgi:polysaccharide biosynthesis transport protein